MLCIATSSVAKKDITQLIKLIFSVFISNVEFVHTQIFITRSLGALRAPTSSQWPFGLLDFVLRALRALRPCDPCTIAGVGNDR